MGISLWAKPKMHGGDSLEEERKVSWLELFFDLVFVVVISRLTHKLAMNISFSGIQSFLLLLIPVWWAWIGATYYSERLETEGLDNRLFTFLKMLPVVGMAIFINDGLGDGFREFVLSYTLARGIVALLWQRGGFYYKPLRPITHRLGIGHSIAIILYLIAGFSAKEIAFPLFGSGLFIDLITPLWIVKYQKGLPQHSTAKLAERFGLLIIIVLGETIVGIVQGLIDRNHFSFQTVSVAITGMAVAFSLWWLYFDYVGTKEPKHDGRWLFFWSYMHFPLVVGIIFVGASLSNIIAGYENLNIHDVRFLIASGIALYLITLSILKKTLHPKKKSNLSPSSFPLSQNAFRLFVNPKVSFYLKIILALFTLILAAMHSFIALTSFMFVLLLLLLIQIIYSIYENVIYKHQ